MPAATNACREGPEARRALRVDEARAELGLYVTRAARNEPDRGYALALGRALREITGGPRRQCATDRARRSLGRDDEDLRVRCHVHELGYRVVAALPREKQVEQDHIG